MRESMWLDDVAPSTSDSQQQNHRALTTTTATRSRDAGRHRTDNVFRLITLRERAPRRKRFVKRCTGVSSEGDGESFPPRGDAKIDARQGLMSWIEAESLGHLSAKYCPLLPPPRSTIAAAFSSDGRTLASTHGDHTVKIIDCYTGNCLKVLSGHRRTPWVVRFHPLCPEILASGSLDHEVRLWDAATAECITSKDFYRPIASIAFHAQGEVLAVASGHKLFIWHYNKRGENSEPAMVLKTKRSLRAVLFHPHGAPLLLTAEVNDLDSSDSAMTVATSQGYLRYPPATVYVANTHSGGRSNSGEELPLLSLPLFVWPSLSRDDGVIPPQLTDGDVGSNSGQQRLGAGPSVRLFTYSTPIGQYDLLLSPVEANNQSSIPEQRNANFPSLMDIVAPEPSMDAMDRPDVQHEERNTQFFPFGDPAYLSFWQGWLAGQGQVERRSTRSQNTNLRENSPVHGEMVNHEPLLSAAIPISAAYRRNLRARSSRSRAISTNLNIDGAALHGSSQEDSGPQTATRIPSELATSLAAAAASELPCTVKLRIWAFDIEDPCAGLADKKCRLTIPHAVLCSEMGAHFSPCGRFLAACVACVLRNVEGDTGLQAQAMHDGAGASTSPTRHPLSAHQVIYELRIYSLEEATFGEVIASRAVRAAHCLTSIQFSPTSEHLLLAYGRRHGSLLQSVVTDGETSIHIYTILEVYRVSDMELVRVLPSSEDEVNVACFHPSVGQGLVYGTKEGKLRVLQYDGSNNYVASGVPDEHVFEVPTYALEG